MTLFNHTKFKLHVNLCVSLCMCVLVFNCASALAHKGVKHDHGEITFTPNDYQRLISPSAEQGSLDVMIKDEHNHPTPAFISIKYADSWQYIVLEQQFLPNPRLSLQRSNRPQWKTKFPIHTLGHAKLVLPVGKYQILVGKGIEYTPQTLTFEINKDKLTSLDISLKRFVNMPQQGWWSGDTHVHAARNSAKDDRELLWAAQAEDIHVSSVLVMGDAKQMHFPQYALGDTGIVQENNYWLVPGQEEPRTSELGHTILLNTQKLYRNTGDYYRYDTIFKQARKDGALTGIAHFFGDKFYAKNAGALLLAEGLVDFVELLDNDGIFNPQHYYDALNIGARLSLTAGSDFPWGGHIGDNRTYAFIGENNKLTPSKWYQAVKAGKTFITQGPILSFTINGETIGSDLHLKVADAQKISVRAQGNKNIGIPKALSLISMGDVIHKLDAENTKGDSLEFNLELKADHSRWFIAEARAHNGAIAHSSPIYITVNNADILAAPDELLTLYQQNLSRIEQLTSAEFVPQQQRPSFVKWLNKMMAIYQQKIQALENQ
ncbi:CehA/McbA family metallohydrolase [Paraglaciecola arctica]|uniref:CehA/McbA family metallohydrolase n=1 Tax=Paraglaciecola arctica TaxID=1128911 RepID=UPI001C06F19A|nr:CehA/McbA family metallohydrolase [Paraglaciecola arctica]MBU3004250.1 CehA/McbA family metallohydrolase [Paraglaciecola arctica]